MLSNKDFVAITQALRSHVNPDNPHLSPQATKIVFSISNHLSGANPTTFNRTAFLIACGVVKEPEKPATATITKPEPPTLTPDNIS